MKMELDNIGFTFYDLVKYTKAYAPNMKKENMRESQSFWILNILDILTSIDEDTKNISDLVTKIDTFHREFLKDVSTMSIAFMVTLNCDIEKIDNKSIKEKANMFKALSSYSKNPLEPLLKLLIKDSIYKRIISDIISAICRGDHTTVKLEIYELLTTHEKYGGMK